MSNATKSETVKIAFSLENVDPNSYEINFMHPESDSTERCVFFLDPCVTINNIVLEEGSWLVPVLLVVIMFLFSLQ